MWEVRKRLIQYGYEVGLIQKVLDKLLMNGVLNDEDFVKQWIETRNYSHPRSRRFLIMELKKKGVTEELIQRTTQKEQFEEDEITAYRAGAKYSWRLRNLDWKTFRQRLGMYLVRRGYQYEVVDSVVKTLWLETQRTDDF